MSRYFSYLNTAKNIIEQYQAEMPLAIYLKKYFNSSKKYGGTDRKEISSLIYNYFRVGNALVSNDLVENILISSFLCSSKSSIIIENQRPKWGPFMGSNLEEKKQFLGLSFDNSSIFPNIKYLSKAIDQNQFCSSFLVQPNLFVRIRPGHHNKVLNKLKLQNVEFQRIGNDCLSFKNNTKVNQYLMIGQEVIIQDYSSQRVGQTIEKYLKDTKSSISVWDCCAASGGKSIMLFDQQPYLELTVSDIRSSILENLKERFQLAGINKYSSFVADLSLTCQMPNHYFDAIIADVPCSGSGTWTRTPEEKHFFDESKIEYYSNLQFEIVQNVVQNLKENGLLFYITCSVFAQENELQIEKICSNLSLELIDHKTLQGAEYKADSMFIGIFRKRNKNVKNQKK